MTTNKWNIDGAHSSINFSIRHMVVSKVRGRFAKYTGKVDLDEGNLTRSFVEATSTTSVGQVSVSTLSDSANKGPAVKKHAAGK